MTKISRTKLRVTTERQFSVHHVLLSTAMKALKDAEREPGIVQHQLIAMTLSALALEALANAFGKRFVPNWKHFEMAPPVAKIRTVSHYLDMQDIDFEKEPGSDVVWLMKFRNKIVHAKPERIVSNKVMTHEQFHQEEFDFPQSKLELDISLSNAKRAVTVVRSILCTLLDSASVTFNDLEGLLTDAWSSSSSLLTEES